MAWCEANRVDHVFELARNAWLGAELAADLAQVRAAAERSGKPARRFKDFAWATRKSWSRMRRVIGKAEWTQNEANPRCIITSLTPREIDARKLYDLLRPRRSREPHQGMPARPVRRSHVSSDA